jgi:hypothetical protein
MLVQLPYSETAQKQKPTARSLLAVGSVNLLKIALLHHPFPSSRRHVIRVDMPVPVDVIRFAFWTRVFMKTGITTAGQQNIGRIWSG